MIERIPLNYNCHMNVEHNVPLSEHSTFHIGGPAEFFTRAESEDALIEAVRWARSEGVSWRVIGHGSNMLFADQGMKGLTIQNAHAGIRFEEQGSGVLLTVASGTSLDALVAFVCEKGWWGLENLSGIPGTVGAVPVQNVGAYGVEVAELIRSVKAYDTEEDVLKTLSPEECSFSYRHSLFKEPAGARYVITEVSFFLSKDAGPRMGYRDIQEYFKDAEAEHLKPQDVRRAVIEIRSRKFPDWNVYGTAGSFFKNPIISEDAWHALRHTYPELPGHVAGEHIVKVPLGWILDHVCALRGAREGAVGTYGTQALVIVNYGGATADDITRFAQKIMSCVKEKTNIVIEWEVTRAV